MKIKDLHHRLFNDFYDWVTGIIECFKSESHIIEAATIYVAGWTQARGLPVGFYEQAALAAANVAGYLWERRDELCGADASTWKDLRCEIPQINLN